jgi:hypothetical protein
MNHRFILGTAAAVAAVVAVPSFASAATTCSYDTIKRQVDIQLANPTFGGQTAILRTSGDFIKVADNNEQPRSCFIPGFTDVDHAAIEQGTNKIHVKGSPGFERVLVSERDGSFAPGSLTNPDGGTHHILLALLTGTGNDVIDVEGGQFADAMSVFGSHFGGQVDMDNDGDTDLAVTAPGRINVIGGPGGDRLAAFGVFGSPALMPVTLDGGEGNDTLFGGQTAGDLLLGGSGNADFINSVAGGADVVSGGDGTLDQAFVDASDTVSTVEVKTVKVGKLGGSAKSIKGDAGETLSLPVVWTHPKAWKELRSIEAIAFDGAKRVGTIRLTPAGALSATGKLSIDRGATRIGHHGKTVSAELGLKVAKSLKGHTLSVDIAATDSDGHRQLQPGARSIRINP